MLYLGFIGTDCVLRELFYKETILQRMVIFDNSFGKFHIQTCVIVRCNMKGLHCTFCLFYLLVLLLTAQVNSYGHGGTVSSPNLTFFLSKLEQAVNQYFVHILSRVITYVIALMF